MLNSSIRGIGALLVLSLTGILGCEGWQRFDQGSGQFAQAVAPRDPVTGARTLQLYPPQHEIEQGSRNVALLLGQCKTEGHQVDSDCAEYRRVKRVFADVTSVTHLPELPWEVHYVDVGDPNAYTCGGGKVVVLRGLFGGLIDPRSDDELAAILAHEAAHVCCRHISERESWQLASALSKNLHRRFAEDGMFSASFTTKQEEEADNVSILYMTLAGYDPAVVPRVWGRIHVARGSDPGNYLYNHPLPADRARNVAAAVAKARKYYAGAGQRNPQYKEILLNNDLVQRRSLPSDSGLLQLLEAFANSAQQYEAARTEEKVRKEQMRSQQALTQPTQPLLAPKLPATVVTINVLNSNGSITPVVLRKQQNGWWLGPRGEQYSQLPTEAQLRRIYGF